MPQISPINWILIIVILFYSFMMTLLNTFFINVDVYFEMFVFENVSFKFLW